jgi:hypothetical protein
MRNTKNLINFEIPPEDNLTKKLISNAAEEEKFIS